MGKKYKFLSKVIQLHKQNQLKTNLGKILPIYAPSIKTHYYGGLERGADLLEYFADLDASDSVLEDIIFYIENNLHKDFKEDKQQKYRRNHIADELKHNILAGLIANPRFTEKDYIINQYSKLDIFTQLKILTFNEKLLSSHMSIYLKNLYLFINSSYDNWLSKTLIDKTKDLLKQYKQRKDLCLFFTFCEIEELKDYALTLLQN